MAAGSSAPELATVVIGVFFAKDDIGVMIEYLHLKLQYETNILLKINNNNTCLK